MTQRLADFANVNAMLQQLDCEGMAEPVREHPVCGNPRLCEDFAILLIEGADGARRIDSLGHLRARIGHGHANLRLIAPAIASNPAPRQSQVSPAGTFTPVHCVER